MSAPVKVGALRAIASLASKVGGPASLQPLLPALLSSLVGLMGQSSEETLHLLLETLVALVKVRGEGRRVCVRRGVCAGVVCVCF